MTTLNFVPGDGGFSLDENEINQARRVQRSETLETVYRIKKEVFRGAEASKLTMADHRICTIDFFKSFFPNNPIAKISREDPDAIEKFIDQSSRILTRYTIETNDQRGEFVAGLHAIKLSFHGAPIPSLSFMYLGQRPSKILNPEKLLSVINAISKTHQCMFIYMIRAGVPDDWLDTKILEQNGFQFSVSEWLKGDRPVFHGIKLLDDFDPTKTLLPEQVSDLVRNVSGITTTKTS